LLLLLLQLQSHFTVFNCEIVTWSNFGYSQINEVKDSKPDVQHSLVFFGCSFW